MGEKLFNVGIKGVITRKNKVLILKGAPGKDIWELPGGRIDKNETIQETLLRELSEELTNIKNIIVQEVLDAYSVHKEIKDAVSLVLIFDRVEAEFDGKPTLSHEHVDYKWATKKEALEIVEDSSKNSIKNAFS